MTRLEELIAAHRKLRDNTKRNYIAAVKSFVRFAGENARFWSTAQVDRWLQAESERVSAQTANLRLAGLKWASARRAIVDDVKDFAAAVEPFPTEGLVRAVRSLTATEARALLATCPVNGVPMEIRDRVILLLGLRVGLRRHEIAAPAKAGGAGLTWGDFALATATIAAALTVRGKGGSEEVVQLDDEVLAALRAWRKVSAPGLCRDNLPLLRRARVPLDVTSTNIGLTPGGIYCIVKARAAQAGITNMGPHTLRHSFVSLALDAGVEPWRVQKAARHSDLRTTMGDYAHDLKSEAGAPVGASLGKLLGDGEEDDDADGE